jgi:hypothetical protein
LGDREQPTLETGRHISREWKPDICWRWGEKMALFRRSLLNLIKAHPLWDSVAGKMMRAVWDSKFNSEILFGRKSNKV